MPSGIHLTLDEKKLLVHHLGIPGHQSVDWLHDNLFFDPGINKDYLRQLCDKITQMTPHERHCYLSEPAKTRGRPQLLSPDSHAREYLDYIQRKHRTMHIKALTTKFHNEFYDAHTHVPGLSTVYKAVKENNSRKTVSYKNIRRDPEEQLNFLLNVSPIQASNIIDIDGLVQSPGDFLKKHGYMPPGELLQEEQIIIEGRNFPVMAAHCENGFICWKIYNCNVTDNEVAEFVNSLEHCRVKTPDSFLILDNAANQSTERVLNCVSRIFHNKYRYCAPYSPEFKPIGNGFSLVKRYIRDHHRSGQDPIKEINDAFNYYSINKDTGRVGAYESYNLYRRNHNLYVERL
jgi:hypothetical protein